MASDLAREALEPFAKVARWLADDVHDEETIWPGILGNSRLRDEAPLIPTVGDLRRARTALEALPADAGTVKGGIYVASKTRHASMWKGYRERGWPIISTWIDEAGEGESGDLNDLWQRCIAEASSARVLVVYREADDVLKGGWIEVGAALASRVEVYAVGLEGFTIAHDRRIRHFRTLDDAMDTARKFARLAPTLSGKAEAVPVGEAVAWQYLAPGMSGWLTVETEGFAKTLAGDHGQIRPLYPATPVEEPGEVERLVEETGSSSVHDLRDMALVGHSLMEVIGIVTADGPYKDWAPAENPTEIVSDLINDLDETRERLEKELSTMEREARWDMDHAKLTGDHVEAKCKSYVIAALGELRLRAALTGDAQEAGE